MRLYRVVHFVGPLLGVLIVADLFAQIGALFGERVLAISTASLCSAWVVFWWITERTRWGAGYRTWREERRMRPIREEAQRIAEEEAQKATAIINASL